MLPEIIADDDIRMIANQKNESQTGEQKEIIVRKKTILILPATLICGGLLISLENLETCSA